MRIAALALFLSCAVATAADPILASGVNWNDQFGIAKESPQTVFCLMARGFFQGPTSPEMGGLVTAWLHDHPKAVVIPVAVGASLSDKDPKTRLTFVWIVDGAKNLNLELVRQGCFSPQTQTIGQNQSLVLPEAKYTAFVQKAFEAGKNAEEKKLGVWKTPAE